LLILIKSGDMCSARLTRKADQARAKFGVNFADVTIQRFNDSRGESHRREERSKILANLDQKRRHRSYFLLPWVRFILIRTTDQARGKLGQFLIGTSDFLLAAVFSHTRNVKAFLPIQRPARERFRSQLSIVCRVASENV